MLIECQINDAMVDEMICSVEDGAPVASQICCINMGICMCQIMSYVDLSIRHN
jgi:hypothetical protein